MVLDVMEDLLMTLIRIIRRKKRERLILIAVGMDIAAVDWSDYCLVVQ